MRDCVAIRQIRSCHRFVTRCLTCVLRLRCPFGPALALADFARWLWLTLATAPSVPPCLLATPAGQTASQPRRIMLVAHREGIRELSRVAEGSAITNTPYCCVGIFRYSPGGALPAHGSQASQSAQAASQAGALP